MGCVIMPRIWTSVNFDFTSNVIDKTPCLSMRSVQSIRQSFIIASSKVQAFLR
jgi:hypothetical protein